MAVDADPLGPDLGPPQEAGLETQLQMSGISRSLFGEAASPSRLGRFVVLEKIGAGAMGTVFRAYDPDLDRSVALKVIRSEALLRDSNARSRLAREARTLAKLNHPNVVGVHEVGTANEQMYLALELVESGDLAHWIQENPDLERRFGQALKFVLQAGEGLKAAHGAGLVHRDLKPANILLGTDGRVRVADFGLARTVETESIRSAVHGRESVDEGSLTETQGVVGTPAYMAPEQRDGRVPDALSDQYAFCVTAWEALFGARPLPDVRPPEPSLSMSAHRRSAARALRRGLSSERTERFDTLRDLLLALAKNPTRRRRRAVGAVATVALAAVAVTGVQLERESRCDTVADGVGDAWNPEVAQEVRRGFDAVDFGGVPDSWERFAADADAFARRWEDAVQESCRAAKIAGTLDAQTARARSNCFDEQLARFEGVLDVYREPDLKLVLAPSRLSRALGPLELCTDRPRRVLDGPQDISRELARALGVLDAGRPAEAVEMLERVVERADSEGAAALKARAQVGLGQAQVGTRGMDAALETLEQAYWGGLEHADDTTAARAARHLAYSLAGARDLDGAERWLKPASVLARRARVGPDDLSRLEITRARIARIRGDLDEAQALYQSAADIVAAVYGPEHAEVLTIEQNIIMVMRAKGELAEATELAEDQLRKRVATFGPMHPRAASGHALVATLYGTTEKFDASVEHFKAAIEIQTAAFGRDHWRVANNLASLGTSLGETGDQRQALEAFREAADTLGRVSPADNGQRLYAEMSLGQALVVHEQCDEGVALMSDVVDVLAKGSEGAQDDSRLATARLTLGACQGRLGLNEAAIGTLKLALAAMNDSARGRAEVMLELARVEHRMGASVPAMQRLDEVLVLLAADEPALGTEAQTKLLRAMLAAESGERAEGAKQARDVLDRIGDTPLAAHRQVEALVDAARVLVEAGELPDARSVAHQAKELLERSKLSSKIAQPILERLRSVLQSSKAPENAR